MMLKNRLDYAWYLVLKHKAHYFGGVAGLLIGVVTAFIMKSIAVGALTLLLYILYMVSFDLYVLTMEGVVNGTVYGDTVGKTTEEKEESEFLGDDDYDEYDSCGDCDFCEEECQYCGGQTDEQCTEKDEEFDEHIWGE